MRQTVIFILVVLVLTTGCDQPTGQRPVQPKNLNDGISTDLPENVGMDGYIIQEIVDSIRSGYYPNRHSLLVYKNGKLVSEDYFTGQDYNWGRDIGIVEHGDTVLHDMRSVSKSVVSACIGIAIEEGMIKGVDQPVFDFFSDYEQFKKEGREKLTIRHLLTMTSGLEWNEEVPYNNPENSEIQMDESGDGTGFVLSRKLVTEPGTEWKYNGGTTELLAAIIKRVSGKDVHAFAEEYIFQPLGIYRSEWTHSTGTDTPAAASGLRLTSRDMLKFGVLYLSEGMWGPRQIIPRDWVMASLKSSISRPKGGGYGYQFWTFDYAVNGDRLTIPAAVGNGDQRVFIDKKNDLLVVTTAGNYNLWDIENNSSAILEKIYGSFNPEQ